MVPDPYVATTPSEPFWSVTHHTHPLPIMPMAAAETVDLSPAMEPNSTLIARAKAVGVEGSWLGTPAAGGF